MFKCLPQNEVHIMQTLFAINFVSFLTVVGIYVNGDGVRSRTQELLWHSNPTQIGIVILNLYVHVHVHVFVVHPIMGRGLYIVVSVCLT